MRRSKERVEPRRSRKQRGGSEEEKEAEDES